MFFGLKTMKTYETLSKTIGLYENSWFCLAFHRFFIVFRLEKLTPLKQNLYFCQILSDFFFFASRPSFPPGAISLSFVFKTTQFLFGG